MGITSKIKTWAIKTLPGMNNKTEDLELKEQWVELAQNARFESEPGSVKKREPITFYNSTPVSTSPVVGLYRYYTKTGNGYSIMVCGTQAYAGDDAAGTWTSIRTGLTDGKRCDFTTYRNIAIVSNGYDKPWCYDGDATNNVTWELGSCKALLAGDGAGNVNSGTHSYKIVFNSLADGSGTNIGITGAVSNTITTTAGDGKVTLSNIPIGPAGWPYRMIYRTTAGTSNYYRVNLTAAGNPAKPASVGATTFTDNYADDTTDAMPISVGDEMPVGNILKVHRERLFISGDPSNPNRIYYSEPYLPWLIRQTTQLDYMDVDADDGDEIMGIPIQLGTMACIKKNTIRKLHITTATAGSDPNSWYADDPIAFVGCPAQWTIQQTPYGVMFLGWDHWYLYDGMKAQPIIDEFNTNEILTSTYSDVVSFWNRDGGVLMWAYADATTSPAYHNMVGRYNWIRQALSVDTVSDDADGNHYGVNCFAANTGDDETGELFYGASTDGTVMKAEVGELSFKLLTKTQAQTGTGNNIFYGGTEASPIITIGSVSSADTIPDNVCIFWNGPSNTPGAGWVEITDDDDKFIKFLDGSAAGTDSTVATDAGETPELAAYLNFRMFKASSCTTSEFPNGAIVMYNSTIIPVGYTMLGSNYYIKLNSDLSSSGGTFIVYPEYGGDTPINLSNEAKFIFIQKIGEASTWDGDGTRWALCPYAGATFTFNACTAADDSDVLEFTDATHGMSVNDSITFKATVLPTGISDGVIYFITDVGTGDTFQVSAELGGTPIAWTDAGTAVTYAEGISGFYEMTKYYDGYFLKTGEDNELIVGGDTARAGSKDWITDETTTHSQGPADASAYDGDRSTYYGGGASYTSTHLFAEAHDITAITLYAYVYANTNEEGDTAYGNCYTQYTLNGTDWVSFTDTELSQTKTHSPAGRGDIKITLDQTLFEVDVADCMGIRVISTCAGADASKTYLYEIGAYGQHEAVSYKLVGSILGKMKDYNAALTTANTNGMYISTQSQINAETLSKIFWNESRATADDVQIFLRLGATQAALAATAVTASSGVAGVLLFTTSAVHGLAVGDRLEFTDSTTNPTGISDNIMYYVESLPVADATHTFTVKATSAGAAIDYSDAGTTVKFKTWDLDAGNNTYTNPNGATINNTANVWLEYAIVFTAVDTTVSNPNVYFTNGYVLKYTYNRRLTPLETAVTFIYDLGFRNFQYPMVDKIFKKIFLRYATEDTPSGSFNVYWKVDIPGNDAEGNPYDEYDPNTTGLKSFTVSLASFPIRWEAFFPSIATGRELSMKIYKSDLEDFTVRELKGVYTPEPIII